MLLLRTAAPMLLGMAVSYAVMSSMRDAEVAALEEEMKAALAEAAKARQAQQPQRVLAEGTTAGAEEEKEDNENDNEHENEIEVDNALTDLLGGADEAAGFKPPPIKFHPMVEEPGYSIFTKPLIAHGNLLSSDQYSHLTKHVKDFLENVAAKPLGAGEGVRYVVPKDHGLNTFVTGTLGAEVPKALQKETAAHSTMKSGRDLPLIVEVLEPGQEVGWYRTQQVYDGREYECVYIVECDGSETEYIDRNGKVQVVAEEANSMLITVADGAKHRVKPVRARRVALRLHLSRGGRETRWAVLEKLVNPDVREWFEKSSKGRGAGDGAAKSNVLYDDDSDGELGNTRARFSVEREEVSYGVHWRSIADLSALCKGLRSPGWIEKDGVVKFLATGRENVGMELYEGWNVYLSHLFLVKNYKPPEMPKTPGAGNVVVSTPQAYRALCKPDTASCTVAHLPKDAPLAPLAEKNTWVLNHSGKPRAVLHALLAHLGAPADSKYFAVKVTGAANGKAQYQYVAVAEGATQVTVEWPAAKPSETVGFPQPWE